MKYETFPPPPHLAAHVRYFWVLEGKGPYVHRSMASGSPELVFHFKGGFSEAESVGENHWQNGHLQGPMNRYRRFATDQTFAIFGVFLYPFALPDLFWHPADILANEMVDLEDLLGKEGRSLSSRILAAESDAERIKHMVRFLTGRLTRLKMPRPELNTFVQGLVHRPHQVDIEGMAEHFGCSRRQFERRFKARAGFSPKHFARISRFQASLDNYGQPIRRLSDIAYSHGYYDHSHFSSEFRQFSGHSPREYFFGKAEGTAWREA